MGVDRLRVINTSELLDDVLKACLTSRDARVRRDAVFFWLAEGKNQPSVRDVTKFVLDRSNSVRTQAARWLQDRGVDVLELVLQRFRDPTERPKNVRLAILSIVQLKRRELLPEILERMNSAYPSIRAASLFAMAKLDPGSFKTRFIDLLQDPSPAFIKLLVRLHISVGVQFDASQLRRIIECDSREIIFYSVLSLSRHINKWERLAFLLDLPVSASSTVLFRESRLREEIRDWQNRFNRSSTAPTREQGERLKAIITEGGRFLSVREWQELSFALKDVQ